MSPRLAGRRKPCTIADARARLHDAEAFLDAAHTSRDPDVIATNAIHSAIAAADAICCAGLRERSAVGNHQTAADLLGQLDKSLAAVLRRALDRKQQAAYEARDIAASDAKACVRQATTLIDAARTRVQGI